MPSIQLAQDEHIVFEGHPSWRATLAFYIKGILGAIVLLAAFAGIASLFADGVDTTTLAIVGLVLLVLVLVGGYVWRMATTYTITNRRLHIKRGIVARKTQEARLERVQNVNTDQSVLGRLLRVGTVDFDTAGSEGDGFRFEGVADPLGVVQSVDRAQREFAEHQIEQSAGYGGEPGTSVRRPPPADPGP
ncbi:MAG TPA: PH domain-containing protein [Thermoleophilaceae bacterium]|nr:PH domain-containing protein [Thermoleophilaceae bacterium]